MALKGLADVVVSAMPLLGAGPQIHRSRGPVGSDSLCLVAYSSAVVAFVGVDLWELEVTHLTWYGALPEEEQCSPEQSRLGFLQTAEGHHLRGRPPTERERPSASAVAIIHLREMPPTGPPSPYST